MTKHMDICPNELVTNCQIVDMRIICPVPVSFEDCLITNSDMEIVKVKRDSNGDVLSHARFSGCVIDKCTLMVPGGYVHFNNTNIFTDSAKVDNEKLVRGKPVVDDGDDEEFFIY